MRSKYTIPRNLPLGKHLRWHARSCLHNVGAPWTKPLRTNKSFAFIAGCGHSGTTLIAAKLGRHDDIFLVGRESGIFLPDHGLYSAKTVAREWAYIAEHLRKNTILEKTPSHIHCIRRAWHILPEAKIILTVRNPLDNISSLKTRFSLSDSVSRWLIDNTPIPALANHPYVLLIRYEATVSNPRQTFRAICDFLDLGYSDELIEAGPTAFSGYQHKGEFRIRDSQVSQPVYCNSLNVWQDRLSREEADTVRLKTEKLAKQLGYA